MDSFKGLQAAIRVSPKIFQRTGLEELYNFLTEGSNAEMSFVVLNKISLSDHHQLWHTIHAGATTAIRSVRVEFRAKPQSIKVQTYLNQILDGKNRMQLLFSIKGTHHLLTADSVLKPIKGPSLIKLLICILKIYREIQGWEVHL